MTSGHCFCILAPILAGKKLYVPSSPGVGEWFEKGYTRQVGPTHAYFKIFGVCVCLTTHPEKRCHRPDENQMFLGYLCSKTNFGIFSDFFSIDL